MKSPSDLVVTGGSIVDDELTDAELVRLATGTVLSDEDAASLCEGLRSTIASSPHAAGRDPDEVLVDLLRYMSPPADRPPARPGCAGVG